MEINFDSPITNLKGITLEGEDKENVILKNICVNALMTEIPNNNDTGEIKLKRFNLAQKIYVGGKIEVTAEEVALLKERIGLCFSTLIVGRAWELLESKK